MTPHSATTLVCCSLIIPRRRMQDKPPYNPPPPQRGCLLAFSCLFYVTSSPLLLLSWSSITRLIKRRSRVWNCRGSFVRRRRRWMEAVAAAARDIQRRRPRRPLLVKSPLTKKSIDHAGQNLSPSPSPPHIRTPPPPTHTHYHYFSGRHHTYNSWQLNLVDDFPLGQGAGGRKGKLFWPMLLLSSFLLRIWRQRERGGGGGGKGVVRSVIVSQQNGFSV